MARTTPEGFRQSNLPIPSSRFIGRVQELAQLSSYLTNGNRLVTITGTGGGGKTRLAIQAGHYFTSFWPVTLVELAPVQSPALVVKVIANSLGLREGIGTSLVDRLMDELNRSPAMLILDNFEHLSEAAGLVAELLCQCPELRILVTSRRSLQLPQEEILLLHPLSTPDPEALPDLDQMSSYEAVELFIECASIAYPEFTFNEQSVAAVAAIVNRLDGIPLAIELAAARCRHSSPQSLLDHLQVTLPVLTVASADSDDRHHTMRNAIDWSYQQLPVAVQLLFRRLSVFQGGFDLEGVKAIANVKPAIEVDPLNAIGFDLLDHGLIVRRDLDDGSTRYRLLEPVREFALEKLVESGEERATRIGHARYFLGRAEIARPQIESDKGVQTLDWYALEHENLRLALNTFLQQRRRLLAGRMALALWKFWVVRRHLQEGRQLLSSVLSLFDQDEPDEMEPELWYASSSLSLETRDLASARDQAIRGIEIAKRLDDQFWHSGLLSVLAHAAARDGEYERAANLYDIVLNVQEPLIASWSYVEHAKAMIMEARSRVLFLLGERAAAEQTAQEAIGIWLKRGDKWGIGLARLDLAQFAQADGELERSLDLYEESLPLLCELGDMASVYEGLLGLADLAADEDLYELAAQLLGRARSLEFVGETSGAHVSRIDAEFIWERLRSTPHWNQLKAILEAAERDQSVAIADVIDRAIAEIRAIFNSEVTTAAVSETAATSHGAGLPQSSVLPAQHNLTKREVEVLCFISQGKTDQEAADHFFLSYRTITSHVAHIYSKLDVKNRAGAIAWAFTNGVCVPSQSE